MTTPSKQEILLPEAANNESGLLHLMYARNDLECIMRSTHMETEITFFEWSQSHYPDDGSPAESLILSKLLHESGTNIVTNKLKRDDPLNRAGDVYNVVLNYYIEACVNISGSEIMTWDPWRNPFNMNKEKTRNRRNKTLFYAFELAYKNMTVDIEKLVKQLTILYQLNRGIISGYTVPPSDQTFFHWPKKTSRNEDIPDFPYERSDYKQKPHGFQKSATNGTTVQSTGLNVFPEPNSLADLLNTSYKKASILLWKMTIESNYKLYNESESLQHINNTTTVIKSNINIPAKEILTKFKDGSTAFDKSKLSEVKPLMQCFIARKQFYEWFAIGQIYLQTKPLGFDSDYKHKILPNVKSLYGTAFSFETLRTGLGLSFQRQQQLTLETQAELLLENLGKESGKYKEVREHSMFELPRMLTRSRGGKQKIKKTRRKQQLR